jgi:hypothetical protein
MNYYLTSQLVAERQAAVAADVTRRAEVRDARAARKANKTSAASAVRPARVRWVFFGRLAHASA